MNISGNGGVGTSRGLPLPRNIKNKQTTLQKLPELTLYEELWKTVKGLQQPGERTQIEGNIILTVTLALPCPLPSTTADLKSVTCVPGNCVFSFDLSMDSLRD